MKPYYMKPYICVLIISIKLKCLKPYNGVKIVLDEQTSIE